mgnify:FL=1
MRYPNMARSFPAFPDGPYHFEITWLWVPFVTDAVSASRLIPAGSGLATVHPAASSPAPGSGPLDCDCAEMVAYVADVTMSAQLPVPGETWKVRYHEAGILVHCRRGRQDGHLAAVLYVDDCLAVLVGRESLGFPKKPGRVTLSVARQGGAPASAQGLARFRGVPVLQAAATALGPSPVVPALTQWWLEKLIPRADPADPASAAVHELVQTDFANPTTVPGSVLAGPAALTLMDGGPESDDLATAIPVLRVAGGLHFASTFDLARGRCVAQLPPA